MRKNREDDRAYHRKYRQEHKKENAAAVNAWRQKRIAWAKEKLGGKCVWCSAVDNLHFDHIIPKTKNAAIQKMVCSKMEKFELELAKCQLLCANCHREKTKQNGEYSLSKPQHGTATMYGNKKCRCELCRQWKSKYDKQRRTKIQMSLLSGK